MDIYSRHRIRSIRSLEYLCRFYTAETIPGATTNELSKYAKKYNMYIIFGMTEKDEAGTIKDNGVEKVIQLSSNSLILMEKLILIRRFIEQARKISGQ